MIFGSVTVQKCAKLLAHNEVVEKILFESKDGDRALRIDRQELLRKKKDHGRFKNMLTLHHECSPVTFK